MKQMAILSGKGGTGKTTVAAALAHLISQTQRVVLADADVGAPNLGIILQPVVESEEPFTGGQVARIDPAQCTACGTCAAVCRFEAVRVDGSLYGIDPLSCEGCGACATQCPAGAIAMVDRQSGYWYHSDTRFGTFIHARLEPGEANSGKLVSRVRAEALAVAAEQGAGWLLIDGSPGTGCPVIAAIAGVDLALLVAEPTVSGWHDLERALAVAAHFRTPAVVCINKSDINPAMTEQITARCQQEGIAVLAHLPYDDAAVRAVRALSAVTELPANPMSDALVALRRSLGNVLSRPIQKGTAQ